MKRLIEWIRSIEKWIYRKTEEDPAWNFLTWLGHGAAVFGIALAFGFLGTIPDTIVAIVGGLFGGPQTTLAVDWSAFAATTVGGFYFWRELVEIYHGQHATGGKVWIWLDHALDAIVPAIVGIWFF